MPGQYVVTSGVARSTPFDNTTNGFVSTDVQSAIEEINSKINTNITVDQVVYVNKGGNDTTGLGTFGQPYLTIAKAISSIVDASPTKRYGVLIGPGDYNENLVLKANMFFIGTAGPIATRITGSTININDTTWNVASADNRSGFQDISVNPVATWDFSAQANNTDGKLYFWNIRTSGAWTATANSNITQVIIQDAEIFGAMTFNGCNTLMIGCSFIGTNVTVNSASTAGQGPAILSLSGGNTSGNITATWTSNGVVTLNLYGIAISGTTILTATGASCTVNAAGDSLPVPANRTFTSSAVLNRINDNFASGLLSATTNISVASATAPTAGQVLTATSSTAAIWGPAILLTTYYATGSTTVTTTSATYTLVSGMTVTPVAGTYIAFFSGTFRIASNGADGDVAIFSGGSIVQASNRRQFTTVSIVLGLIGNNLQSSGTPIGEVTVNGSQAVEGRFRANSGTIAVDDRSLVLVRIS